MTQTVDKYYNPITQEKIKKIRKVDIPVVGTGNKKVETPVPTTVIEQVQPVEVKLEPTVSTKEVVSKHKPKPRKKATVVNKKEVKHEIPLPVIRVISVIITLIAIVRTFAYDIIYYNTLEHPFFALIMSALLVLVSFTSPQVFLFAWKNRNWLVGVISLAFIILSSYYSIFVTSEVVRIKRESNNLTLAQSYEGVVKARIRVEEINTLEQQLLVDKEIELRERNSLQLASEQLIAERKDGTWEYNSMRTRLVASKERYDAITKQIQDLQTERNELRNIDGFYSTTIKTEEDIKQESSRDLVFAVFLDIAGPVFMSFSLFL